jgi:hypothetical protein
MKDIQTLSDTILELSIVGFAMGIMDGNIYSPTQLKYYEELKLEAIRRKSAT